MKTHLALAILLLPLTLCAGPFRTILRANTDAGAVAYKLLDIPAGRTVIVRNFVTGPIGSSTPGVRLFVHPLPEGGGIADILISVGRMATQPETPPVFVSGPATLDVSVDGLSTFMLSYEYR